MCALGSTFETVAPTPSSNRVCSAVTKCRTNVNFETTAPTLTTDRQCSEVTRCASSQFLVARATMTSDTVCRTKPVVSAGLSFKFKNPSAGWLSGQAALVFKQTFQSIASESLSQVVNASLVVQILDFSIEQQGSVYLNLELAVSASEGSDLSPAAIGSIVEAFNSDLSEPLLLFRASSPDVFGEATAMFINRAAAASTNVQSSIVQTAYGFVQGASASGVISWKGLLIVVAPSSCLTGAHVGRRYSVCSSATTLEAGGAT